MDRLPRLLPDPDRVARPVPVAPARRGGPLRRAAAVVATFVAAVVLASGGGPAAADDRTIGVYAETLSGKTLEGRRLAALDGTRVTLDTASGPVEADLADIVEISFAVSPRTPGAAGPADVAVDLWSGEVLHGTLTKGDGETITVDSPWVGALAIPLERIAGVRFRKRIEEATEPPDLRSRKDSDVIHLAGGDDFAATIETLTPTGVVCVRAKARVTFELEKLVAVRLAETDAGPAPAEGLRVALRDGSRLVGTGARIVDGQLRMKSVSGLAIAVAVPEVTSIQVVSPRYAWLSDLPPAKVHVTPVWDLVAGDPDVLFAPRFDASFSGRPLRCGGRTFLDGIGAFSGTRMTWTLDGTWKELRLKAGIDDGAGPAGGVVFQVLVDGKESWSSGYVRGAAGTGRGKASPVTAPAISLAGAKTLELVVLPGDDEDPWPIQDEANWLGPLLLRAVGR